MKMKATLLAALLCLFTFIVAEAQSLPSAKPEQVGLSSERLKEDLFVIFMMQSPKQRVPYRYLLKEMVYAAVTKPAK